MGSQIITPNLRFEILNSDFSLKSQLAIRNRKRETPKLENFHRPIGPKQVPIGHLRIPRAWIISQSASPHSPVAKRPTAYKRGMDPQPSGLPTQPTTTYPGGGGPIEP